LEQPILQALQQEGYEQPTPIQQQSIPVVLEGRDLLGCAQTGTGKTAAFAIPILQLLHKRAPQGKQVRALILTPTRELAIQIEESFNAYGRFLNLRTVVIFGGVSQFHQVEKLRKGADILVATPGRLLDLIQQGFISLKQLELFVLDEADRMLDMGFIHDVRKVIALLPAKRQTLFFSATMPPEIEKLSQQLLHEPAKVEVAPVSTTAEKIEQSVYFVDKNQKKELLIHLLRDEAIRNVLVFTRTKHGADRVVKDLYKAGIQAAAIHGNKSQNARQRALTDFKSGSLRVLVATDIAARGIDVDHLSHVINYELPNIPETYVHRIGRTGRAGASGIAISLCDQEEQAYLKDIQKLIRMTVPVVTEHPFVMTKGARVVQERPSQEERRPQQRGRDQQRNQRGGPRPHLSGQRNNRQPSQQADRRHTPAQQRPQQQQRREQVSQRPVQHTHTHTAPRQVIKTEKPYVHQQEEAERW
jgi:ATP-dependent RNA helicase RhlE